MNDDPKPKPLAGYQYAVITVEGAESSGGQTTLVPMRMSFLDAFTEMFGEPHNWPKGRVCITIPETLPFDPKHAHSTPESDRRG